MKKEKKNYWTNRVGTCSSSGNQPSSFPKWRWKVGQYIGVCTIKWLKGKREKDWSTKKKKGSHFKCLSSALYEYHVIGRFVGSSCTLWIYFYFFYFFHFYLCIIYIQTIHIYTTKLFFSINITNIIYGYFSSQ